MKVHMAGIFVPTLEEKRALIATLTKYEFPWHEQGSSIVMILKDVDLSYFRLDDGLRELEKVKNRRFIFVHLRGGKNGKKQTKNQEKDPDT